MGVAHRAAFGTAIAALLLVATGEAARAGGNDAADPHRTVVVLGYRTGSAELPDIDRRAAHLLGRATSLDVIDGDEARKRFGEDLDARVVACQGEAACVARLGGKLDASEVLLVGVSEFGDVILTLQRIDVATRTVGNRIAEALAPGDAPDDAQLTTWLQRVLPESDFLRYGTIRIAASVAGARVTISGADQGLTPIAAPIRVRAPASYDIRVSKAGYLAFRASVAVPPDGEVDVHPTLSRKSNDPWYGKWWVAALAGTVVVGAAAGVTWLMLDDDPTSVPVGGTIP